MFRSAILKLTAWYVVLAIGLSLMFSAVLYHFAAGELHDALTSQYHQLLPNDQDADNSLRLQAEEYKHTDNLLQSLAAFNAVVLLGAIAAGYLLARRTLRPIEAAHQAQIRFSAEASHQLRTPLAGMRADTEATLMETGLDQRSRQALQANLSDIERIQQLTDKLLDMTRAQSAGKSEEIRLDQVITEAVRQLKPVTKTKKLSIRQKLPALTISADRHAVFQLLTILLDNAAKYSQTSGEIEIQAVASGHLAIITVRDHGIGIPAKDLPRIFEPFYRAQNASNHGYGLGLALAKQIVDAHHGTIAAASQPKTGTVFTVKLPLVSH